MYIYRPNGTTSSNGSPGDAAFAANYSRTEINDETNPSSFLQDGSPGGLNIRDISALGDSMTFTVDFYGIPAPEFSASKQLACVGEEIQLLDKSFGMPEESKWIISPQSYSFTNDCNDSTQNPTLLFHEEGLYDITLISSNNMGTNTITIQAFIKVGYISYD